MTTVNACGMHFRQLNDAIRQNDAIAIEACEGQRFIASGMKGKHISIDGTPGNALGAYLDGSDIFVRSNAQDAVGDTMNDGLIAIDGNAGDALGYAMRGGRIYVRGNSGYRTGIHMKQYGQKRPVIIVGGSAGSFLGEYLAGGVIIVLALEGQSPMTGGFTGTGMHGGKIFLRAQEAPSGLPEQVYASPAQKQDIEDVAEYIDEYCRIFALDSRIIKQSRFQVLTPNAKNPYKRLYTPN